MQKLKIVFMGTPAFATGILRAIIEKGDHEVVGVITVADKPAGRGQKLAISDVKAYALSQKLNILQPTNLKDEIFLKELAGLQADVFVVVAFRMLPAVVWQMPKMGTFNLHASLLPQYRGAAPINWAIINGDVKTGVTTFFIDDKIDTGEIILAEAVEILPNEDFGSLHDKLMNLGKTVVANTLSLIANQKVKTVKQNQASDLKTAYKLNAENCQINWFEDPNKIVNLIRGLSPYPGAWTIFKHGDDELRVKIFEAVFIADKIASESYQLLIIHGEMFVALPTGKIKLIDIQLPNKKRMKVQELLNGWRFENCIFVK